MKYLYRLSKEDGFTLLELLIIVAILAALAGGVIMVLDGAEEDSATKIAKSEMLEIKKALLKFKQDTGYLPKQGPFALLTDTPPGLVPVPSQGSTWFHSPANFAQMYEEPVDSLGSPIRPWNPDTARGWRGPYLTRQGEGLVDIGDGLNTDGTGSPTTIITALLAEVRGVADPFVAKPEGSFFVWRTSPGSTPHDRWGRPYFLFDLDNNNARIVGMGPNGEFEGNNPLDLCSPPLVPNVDDIVLCLFK